MPQKGSADKRSRITSAGDTTLVVVGPPPVSFSAATVPEDTTSASRAVTVTVVASSTLRLAGDGVGAGDEGQGSDDSRSKVEFHCSMRVMLWFERL
ncbi:hypothetical protein AGABI2DRAFT_138563 [Agaricus bisporus var. bisporus H97]|uniref:hypothetical protein n=1 Tax=Agaricus bisporus var. bisporus (strain H97 / ATCC MYA-4626 / FGSC 10389) TaxID=936046 RepID=UPI00029F6866|nr:hypothetical protein AGABI2DRAFT_138563 [Agaricus bisporus var. bisporus H97]EKV44099.1 hypothetical protein AGABI2DRAFT_138563 [Agaricus bisporus var. bisporus H97]